MTTWTTKSTPRTKQYVMPSCVAVHSQANTHIRSPHKPRPDCGRQVYTEQLRSDSFKHGHANFRSSTFWYGIRDNHGVLHALNQGVHGIAYPKRYPQVSDHLRPPRLLQPYVLPCFHDNIFYQYSDRLQQKKGDGKAYDVRVVDLLKSTSGG
ncbi:hypothetical protein PISMIDRAFT_520643 [Pisolithus microcarpus 441]|uniref:Uncharacterized protein n=1 Tax=Pisolithus microcarpus 441 TaxID=765257 RepID=A0A0C9YVV3_9AGAM|nr:hypothetical protein PISMIDRAFT_520643 [Pisolithus microcarpus 441]